MKPFIIISRLWIVALAMLAVTSPLQAAPGNGVASEARPPFWAAKGALVYRISTPDDATTLTYTEKGIHMVSELLDGSVTQISIINGLIGHDHPGGWNWDGLWPYWGRVTFRAGNWQNLAGFMSRIRNDSNASGSFHLNLTDVNIGLRDYPESRAFFEKLVAARAVYRRDYNRETQKHDGVPYVPREIDRYAGKKDEPGNLNPVQIFALVNYKNYWDSGLAKTMIDEFYGHLPYSPPVLYLDVLTLSGGNFSTGYPDGPLGGGKETQTQGIIDIADYLRGKGTDLGTEGNRKLLGDSPDGPARAGYVWYHGRGFSDDDYRVISGGNKTNLAAHHVFGNPGAFNVSPIASTEAGMKSVKAHYAALLAGKPGTKALPGLDTWHIAMRSNATQVDGFDILGANGDVFRGDWADLVDYFYLCGIQELYHIGNRAVRHREDSTGVVHLGTYTVSGPGGEQTVLVPDFVTGWTKANAVKNRRVMLESPITTKVTVAKAGLYSLTVNCMQGGRAPNPQLGIYVNGKHLHSFDHLKIPNKGVLALDAGQIELVAGENTLSFDSGKIRATWTDGTTAEWATPFLRTGFKAWKDDVVFADDYDRMWPDTWSGQKKIYFFSWEGTNRVWNLPQDWTDVKEAIVYALTPDGRGKGITLFIKDRSIALRLQPQVPFVLVPKTL